MQVEIILKKEDIVTEKIIGCTVVVIDVLRATSTMVNALYNGCREIIVVSSPEEAFYLKKLYSAKTVLGGERKRKRLPGFELGNSPLEYVRSVIGNRVIIFTTTNGTELITKCALAEKIIIGSFLNAEAVTDYLKDHNKIILACAGTRGTFSLEDFLLAGYLSWLIKKKYTGAIFCDKCYEAIDWFKKMDNSLVDILKKTPHGQSLIDIGLKDDIQFCLQKNITEIIPQVKTRSFYSRIQIN